MRIAIVTDNLYGGVASHTAALIHKFLEDGHAVSLLFVWDPDNPPPEVGRFRLVGLDFGIIGDGNNAVRNRDILAKIIRGRPDILLWPKGGPFNGRLVIFAAARIIAKRLVTIEHNMPPLVAPRPGRHLHGLIPGFALGWKLKYARMRISSRLPHMVVTVGQGVSRYLIGHGYRKDRIIVVANGIEANAPNLNGDCDRVRPGWGVPSSAIVFGTLGRISIEQKRLDLLIEAFAMTWKASEGEKPFLVVVGEGPDTASLQELAARLGIAAHIRFPGRTDASQEVLAAMDIFVSSSDFEGCSLAILEAMAARRFCIVTNVGSAEDCFPDKSAGWLVPPSDAQALSGAMIGAMTLNEKERNAIGSKAHARVRLEFSSESQLSKLAKVVYGEY